ncbi:UDP-glucuronosyltransferase 2C1-like [Patiria miniata]|uniref:Glucuronosyltransferase n=1 Tax=Patiria miniata TaxID=46514 RepID=A0A913ZR03_PATMI|nr:UDP-glucuronosyltransferase 2C1-like [Patiria miniata]
MMDRHGCALLLLGLCCTGLIVCQCGEDSRPKFKFLVYTGGEDGSHHMQTINVAKGLIRQGHSVTFLLSSSCTKWLHEGDAYLFNFIVYRSSLTTEEREAISEEFSVGVMTGELGSLAGFMKATLRGMIDGNRRRNRPLNLLLNECDDLLGDAEAMHAIREGQFDMLIGDDMTGCNPLLANKLDIPFVLYGCTAVKPTKLQLLYGLPNHPAYIPERQLGLTDNMTLLQRSTNTLMSLLYGGLYSLHMWWGFSALQDKHGIAPNTPTLELMGRAELWIISNDFVLEFPRPLQPNVILVAHSSIGISEDREVPEDQLEFLEGSDDAGVILFSLGTHVINMEVARAEMLARGLAMLPHRVLWHFPGNTSQLPIGNNTKVVEWMPMKKIMAHSKVKAVLCHGGSGLLHEAIWFGLPFVGIPLFGDQFDNMVRAVHKGFAISLDLFDMTEDTLYHAVTRVTREPSFRENARKTSAILRDDFLIPTDKAAYWIAHVTRFGGKHLRPKVLDLNFVQRNLLDVYAFLLTAGFLSVWLGIWACRKAGRLLALSCSKLVSGTRNDDRKNK